jgi:hypothetical protein
MRLVTAIGRTEYLPSDDLIERLPGAVAKDTDSHGLMHFPRLSSRLRAITCQSIISIFIEGIKYI